MLFFLKFLKCLATPSSRLEPSRHFLDAIPYFFQKQSALCFVALCALLPMVTLSANTLVNPPQQLLQNPVSIAPEKKSASIQSLENAKKTTIQFFEKNSDILDASFVDIHGKSMTVRTFLKQNKKPVLLVFWATWCPPCIKEMPSLARMQDQLKDRLDVLPIALDAITDKGGLKQHLKGFKLRLYTSAATSKIMEKRGMSGVPSFIFLSENGRDLLNFSGAKNWDDANVQKMLLDALKPTKADTKTTDSKKNQLKHARTPTQG